MSFRDDADRDARLIILKALAEEVDKTLNEKLLLRQLDRFGHRRSRDYVRNQMRWLATEAGAVEINEAGSVLIATLAKRGRDHLEMRIDIEGIDQPSEA